MLKQRNHCILINNTFAAHKKIFETRTTKNCKSMKKKQLEEHFAIIFFLKTTMTTSLEKNAFEISGKISI